MPKIIATVDKYGNTVVRTEGFSGESCIAASASIEQVLMNGGGKKVSDEKTPEFYEGNSNTEHVATERW